jgi:hypothetical protein
VSEIFERSTYAVLKLIGSLATMVVTGECFGFCDCGANKQEKESPSNFQAVHTMRESVQSAIRWRTEGEREASHKVSRNYGINWLVENQRGFD